MAPAIATSIGGTRQHAQHTCGREQASERICERVREPIHETVNEQVCERVREPVRERIPKRVRERVRAGEAICFSVLGREGGGRPLDDALAGARLSSSAGRALPMCGGDGGRRHSAGSSAATGLGAPTESESAALISLGAGEASGAEGAGGAGGGGGRRRRIRATSDGIGDSMPSPKPSKSPSPSSSSSSFTSSSFGSSLRRGINYDDSSSAVTRSANSVVCVKGRTAAVSSTAGGGGQQAGGGVGSRPDETSHESVSTSDTGGTCVEKQLERFCGTREQRKLNGQQKWREKRRQQQDQQQPQPQQLQQRQQQRQQRQDQPYNSEEGVGEKVINPPPPRRRLVAAARRRRTPTCGIIDVALSDEHVPRRPRPSTSPTSPASQGVKKPSERSKHPRAEGSAGGRNTEVAGTASASPTTRTKTESFKHPCAEVFAVGNKAEVSEAAPVSSNIMMKTGIFMDPRTRGFAGGGRKPGGVGKTAASPTNRTKTEAFKRPGTGGVVEGREPGETGTVARKKIAAFWEEKRQLVVTDGPVRTRVTARQGNAGGGDGGDGGDGGGGGGDVAARPPAADIFLPTRGALASAEAGGEGEEQREGGARKVNPFATTSTTTNAAKNRSRGRALG